MHLQQQQTQQQQQQVQLQGGRFVSTPASHSSQTPGAPRHTHHPGHALHATTSSRGGTSAGPSSSKIVVPVRSLRQKAAAAAAGGKDEPCVQLQEGEQGVHYGSRLANTMPPPLVPSSHDLALPPAPLPPPVPIDTPTGRAHRSSRSIGSAAAAAAGGARDSSCREPELVSNSPRGSSGARSHRHPTANAAAAPATNTTAPAAAAAHSPHSMAVRGVNGLPLHGPQNGGGLGVAFEENGVCGSNAFEAAHLGVSEGLVGVGGQLGGGPPSLLHNGGRMMDVAEPLGSISQAEADYLDFPFGDPGEPHDSLHSASLLSNGHMHHGLYHPHFGGVTVPAMHAAYMQPPEWGAR
ncbi:hypothetical protein DUNSADRAFT_17279 [Dunaliella salina]|uniref:Uncharacterized protein n=1 Tax=Dunaliella salina TaxID=3046 RepID=A0ABQ7G218_DUNSA|nr:hypothetical protein DUNSADRAFT_17279 [Dunaliella salina]|eukprot:KAF5828652.1 hypothetical protein DUNSADRAFT_17279 [Dunaliella salina]